MLSAHEADYRWLSDVYESVRPSDITGRLVWHALGAKTLDLINQHVVVEVPRGDLETIVLDAQVIEDLMSGKDKDRGGGDREADHRADRPPPQQPRVRRARPPPERAAREATPTSSSPASTSCAGCSTSPGTPLPRRSRSARSRARSRARPRSPSCSSPFKATALRSSSRTSSAGSTRSSGASASMAGRARSRVTRRSAGPSAGPSTSSSRSPTTTSSKKPSATSGNTTEIQTRPIESRSQYPFPWLYFLVRQRRCR